MAKQVEVTIENLKINRYSIDAGDFINQLLQRKPENRLGYKSVNELKRHSWFIDFDWNALYKKNYPSPFIPESKDNFDKKYCEAPDEVELSTQERYELYKINPKFKNAFYNFTYIKIDFKDSDNDIDNNANISFKDTNIDSDGGNHLYQQPSYCVLFRKNDFGIGNKNKIKINNNSKDKSINSKTLLKDDPLKSSISSKNIFHLKSKKTFRLKKTQLKIDTSTNRTCLKKDSSNSKIDFGVNYSSNNIHNTFNKNKKILNGYSAITFNNIHNMNFINNDPNKKNSLLESLLKLGNKRLPYKSKKKGPIKTSNILNEKKSLSITIKSPNSQNKKKHLVINQKKHNTQHSLIRVNSLCFGDFSFFKRRNKNINQKTSSYSSTKNIYDKYESISRCKSNYQINIMNDTHNNCKSPLSKIYCKKLSINTFGNTIEKRNNIQHNCITTHKNYTTDLTSSMNNNDVHSPEIKKDRKRCCTGMDIFVR